MLYFETLAARGTALDSISAHPTVGIPDKQPRAVQARAATFHINLSHLALRTQRQHWGCLRQ
jgi:hypothetical protein